MEPNVHYRVWDKPDAPVKLWRPIATYTLLGTIVATFLLQQLTIASRPDLHNFIFTIGPDWINRPWSPLTSMFSHAPFSIGHIVFNGLMLYFFGGQLERVLGKRDFVALFLVSGAVSGILQAELSNAWGSGFPALGASGALMAMFGTLMVLYPNNQLLLYGLIPLRFWVAGVLFATLDILGAFSPNNGIGNFAHLSGMLIGLAFGLGLRKAGADAGKLRRVPLIMR